MIYIYNCYAGTHSSSIASAVHLGQVRGDRIPSSDEILSIDYFNELDKDDMGKIVYRGTDDDGNKVYTLGRGSSKIVVPSMAELLNVLHSRWGLKEKVIFSNMSSTVTMAMTVGGFISRRLRINLIGVPFLIIGTKQAFLKIVEFVNLTKERAKNSDGPVIVLENKL